MSAAGTILRRCVTSVLLSWLVAATDVMFVVKSWMQWFKCRGGQAKFRSAGNTAELAKYQACIGEWGDWVIYYNFINWAIVATAVFVIGPVVEALVYVVLSEQARGKRKMSHSGTGSAVASVAGNSTATVVTVGLWAKTRELLVVRWFLSSQDLGPDIDEWPVRHLFKLKITEVLTKGIMIAVAATVVLRDSSIAKHRRTYALEAAAAAPPPLGTSPMPANYTSAAGPTQLPFVSTLSGMTDLQLGETAKNVQKLIARPVQSFRAVDGQGGVAAPTWWALLDMAVALLTAGHAAAGFIWYCSASAWSSASRRDHDHHSSWIAHCCAHLPFSFFHIFVFQCITIYSTVVVYIYAALHLIANLGDGRRAFFLLLFRWGWQLLIMTAACMRHCSGFSMWLSCSWKSLVSSFTFLPWRIPGATKWGLTFSLDLFGAVFFSLAGNMYFLIVHEDVGRTKTTFSIWLPLSGAILSMVTLVFGVVFQSICWRPKDESGHAHAHATSAPIGFMRA